MNSLSKTVDAAVAARAMLSHPLYRAWSAGTLPAETLRLYARQYFHHVEAFPQAVSATHAACPDRDGRRLLAENLAEEEGLGEGRAPHAELWMRFAAALGVDRAEVEAESLTDETAALIDTFRTLSRRSYAAGLGALYAYESQLPDVSTTKIAGLKQFYGIDDAEGLSFFRVHEAADVEHSAVCRALLDRLSGDDRAEALEAAKTLSEALLGFLTGVERAALH
jgi:pyrroloquinoline-quinone synthase